MAITTQSTSDESTVKLWDFEDYIEIYKLSYLGHMFRRGIITVSGAVSAAGKGDEVSVTTNNILGGIPKGEGQTMVSQEEALNRSTFKMKWTTMRHAVRNPGKDTIEQIRTYTDFEGTARKLLTDYFLALNDYGAFYQLAGAYPTTITTSADGGTVFSGTDRQFVNGLNTISAPTSNRLVRVGGSANDQSITSTDIVTANTIDQAIELLLNFSPTVIPLDNNEFDMFISPKQQTLLKQASGSAVSWANQAIAQIQGGMAENDVNMGSAYGLRPVLTYGNVNVYVSSRVATGLNSSTSAAISTVARSVLCGKDALTYASPLGGWSGSDDVPLTYFTEDFDYGETRGIQAKFTGGLKKTVGANSQDRGVVCMPGYQG